MCCNVWVRNLSLDERIKIQIVRWRKRSLCNRSSPTGYSAWAQGKASRTSSMGCSTAWVLKNNSELTSGRGTYGKMLNRLDKIIKEVQMAIVFIGKLTIESGEHGESALQVCLLLPLSTYIMRPRKLCYQVLGDWNLRGFCKKRSSWNGRFSLYRTLMLLDVFAMLNLQYLGIMSICRMSDGWSFRRIC